MNWTYYLKNTFRKTEDLFSFLSLDFDKYKDKLNLKPGFDFLVPIPFANKMEKKNFYDPLLQQVIPLKEELNINNDYSTNPVNDIESSTDSYLIHKYSNRALMIGSGNCAINCRYCFRQFYDYDNSKFTLRKLNIMSDYLKTNKDINEVILSGGDPLSLSNNSLNTIMSELDKIDSIKFIRIHSRFPVAIPQRIDEQFVNILKRVKKKILFVFHINHGNEIDSIFQAHVQKLQQANMQLLNQSVLLKGINNDAQILYKLSMKLLESDILPYYINQLDKVQGSSHFNVPEDEGLKIIKELSSISSGYMVPKYVKDIPGKTSKTILL